MNMLNAAVKITGISDLLMHCGQTADPLNKFSKAIKKLSGKRGKTDEDLMVLANIEWWAGLYISPRTSTVIDEACNVSVPKTSKIVIPAHIIESMTREGARKQKLGKQMCAGMVVDGDAKLEYAGPKDINQLANEEAFRHSCIVRVGTAKVVRCRPVFSDWSAIFNIMFDPSIVNAEQIKQALQAAGRLVGIGDWRPNAPKGGSYGRFSVESFDVTEMAEAA